MRRAPFAAWLAAALVLVGCSAPEIDVQVEGNVLRSCGFPPAEIKVDPSLSYVGKDRFILYGNADTEIHLFADSKEGRVRRLLWIQFEGYLPSYPFGRYMYGDAPRRTLIGEHPYYDDVWPWDLTNRRKRSGSDTEHVLDLLKRNNLSAGPEVMAIRLVRLNESSRQELMLIYLEDLRDHGLTTGELSRAGSRHEEWPSISDQLRRRALDSFAIVERTGSCGPGSQKPRKEGARP